MHIREIMKEPIHVDKDQRLSHAIDLFKKHNIARLPVLEGGDLVGIITQRDIMDKIGYFKEDLKVSTFHISACMTKDPYTLSPSDSLESAITIFRKRKISGIPIVDEQLVGMVTKLDVIQQCTYAGNVADCYTPQFVSVSASERVVHARMLMLRHNERCFPVIDNALEGIITTADVVYELYKFMDLIDKHQSSLVRNLSVEEAMNQNPVTTAPWVDLEKVKGTMVRDNLSTLPVVTEDSEVLGLISKDEMMQALTV
ncbi:MAG: CBS domain-containing protein [Theionarchaea archaeon]|nr:CBS domain-containing protein [Theionarchaea archaeon]MBU7000129.1 CBS domain-containing protein [Theionarchaea archaeon]MBU7020846.1 CBS domain-containing protein [Theionarchaea archaeon]MBU7033918.1 CBS domain-containing protein [Theionarchaea archaeon]MBU7039214.1 CBS domain-containing protein [Theionarchaea archaeon]